jgi:hypothetical protein
VALRRRPDPGPLRSRDPTRDEPFDPPRIVDDPERRVSSPNELSDAVDDDLENLVDRQAPAIPRVASSSEARPSTVCRTVARDQDESRASSRARAAMSVSAESASSHSEPRLPPPSST